jgi:hypothetical protein
MLHLSGPACVALFALISVVLILRLVKQDQESRIPNWDQRFASKIPPDYVPQVEPETQSHRSLDD